MGDQPRFRRPGRARHHRHVLAVPSRRGRRALCHEVQLLADADHRLRYHRRRQHEPEQAARLCRQRGGHAPGTHRGRGFDRRLLARNERGAGQHRQGQARVARREHRPGRGGHPGVQHQPARRLHDRKPQGIPAALHGRVQDPGRDRRHPGRHEPQRRADLPQGHRHGTRSSEGGPPQAAHERSAGHHDDGHQELRRQFGARRPPGEEDPGRDRADPQGMGSSSTSGSTCRASSR